MSEIIEINLSESDRLACERSINTDKTEQDSEWLILKITSCDENISLNLLQVLEFFLSNSISFCGFYSKETTPNTFFFEVQLDAFLNAFLIDLFERRQKQVLRGKKREIAYKLFRGKFSFIIQNALIYLHVIHDAKVGTATITGNLQNLDKVSLLGITRFKYNDYSNAILGVHKDFMNQIKMAHETKKPIILSIRALQQSDKILIKVTTKLQFFTEVKEMCYKVFSDVAKSANFPVLLSNKLHDNLVVKYKSELLPYNIMLKVNDLLVGSKYENLSIESLKKSTNGKQTEKGRNLLNISQSGKNETFNQSRVEGRILAKRKPLINSVVVVPNDYKQMKF